MSIKGPALAATALAAAVVWNLPDTHETRIPGPDGIEVLVTSTKPLDPNAPCLQKTWDAVFDAHSATGTHFADYLNGQTLSSDNQQAVCDAQIRAQNTARDCADDLGVTLFTSEIFPGFDIKVNVPKVLGNIEREINKACHTLAPRQSL